MNTGKHNPLAPPALDLQGMLARLRSDCRHYRGDRPCAAGVQGVCPSGCERFAAQGDRILLIKLGALGDVIRTAALLPGLKQRWPASHVTWLTRASGARMLRNHPLIDRLLAFDAEACCHLEYERFDLCVCLDKEPGPAALAMRVDARLRMGLGLTRAGGVVPLNPECAPYFALGLDDGLKFRGNRRSYQALVYAALGLRYEGQRYRLYPGQRERDAAAQSWARHGVGDREIVVGLNTGAGGVFANKTWREARFLDLALALCSRPRVRVALLGGPDERERNRALARRCPPAIDVGCDHDELAFAALVSRCDALVTGDTMALHVAVAMDVPVVALFGPTCEQEIDLFGRGEKLLTPLECSPCYRRACDQRPNCMDSIPVRRVVEAVERWIDAPRRRVRPLPVLEGAS
jgi:heptosyltransferase-2